MTKIIIGAHERALEYRFGKLERVLEPGRYRRLRRATYQRIDVRDRLIGVAPQEVLTSDGVTVKVSAAIRWRRNALKATAAVTGRTRCTDRTMASR